MTLAVVLVVISQIKINVTNAYSGSLAWTNSFTRVTKTYPGRLVFLAFNLLIALVLMEANMFDFLNTILGFYANCGMAWVVVVASDIVFNKYLLKLSPKVPEFRRGMLYDFNPVGFGSMLIAAGRVDPRVLRRSRRGDQAVLPAGRHRSSDWCCRRSSPSRRRASTTCAAPTTASTCRCSTSIGNPSDAHLKCHVCHHDYERPDMMKSASVEGYICSLCLSTDKTGENVLPAQT